MHRVIEKAPPRWQLSSKCWVNCRRHLNDIHLEFNSECCSLVLHQEHRLKWRFAGAFSRPGRNNTATTWFCSLPYTGPSLHPSGRMCALQEGLTCSSVAFRMLIKSKNHKIDVDINIRNSKDNAYNTKVTLTFTPNINFMKVEVRFPQRFFLSVSLSLTLTAVCDLFRVLRQTTSALCSTPKWSVLSDTPSLEAMWR